MNELLLFFFVIFSSLLLTELVRRYSLKTNFLDVPNERSSHHTATPRGGGLSIVVVFLSFISLSDLLAKDIVFALIGSGILVAGVGLWDDQGHIAARWRLLSHFTASFWALFWLGVIPEFQFLNFNIDVGWVGMVVVVLLLVWLLNLFNFMDGIDGIAASEAIFVSSGGAFFSYLSGLDDLFIVSLVLATSTAGFLLLNWPPAKIFMGDVGSGFLGLMLGIIAYANVLEGVSIWIWATLLGIFLVDSGITLLRRMANGDKWYEAHCTHAYQHAARQWGHKNVTFASVLINIFWLFPLTYLVYLYSEQAIYIVAIAYIPLILLALKFRAGMAIAGTSS